MPFSVILVFKSFMVRSSLVFLILLPKRTVLYCYFHMYRTLTDPELLRRLPHRRLCFHDISCDLNCTFLYIILHCQAPEDAFLQCMQKIWKVCTLSLCCLKLLPENHRSSDNKRTADHSCYRLADAHSDIAPDRDKPDGKDNFTNQFQRTAYQRCFQVLHSLQCIS